MSFLSILKDVGKALLIGEQLATPIVTAFNPAAGSLLNGINALVVKAEATYTADKQGATKKQMVIDEFSALFPVFQSVLKEQAGLLVTFDASQVGTLIDASVAQLNALKALHDTFKIEKTT